MKKNSFANVLDGYKKAKKISSNRKVATMMKKISVLPEIIRDTKPVKIKVSSASKQRSLIFGKIRRVQRTSELERYMETVSTDSSVETVYFKEIEGGCNVTEILFCNSGEGETPIERKFFLSDKKEMETITH